MVGVHTNHTIMSKSLQQLSKERRDASANMVLAKKAIDDNQREIYDFLHMHIGKTFKYRKSGEIYTLLIFDERSFSVFVKNEKGENENWSPFVFAMAFELNV